MTKGKTIYQVKLILEHLPEEEYKLIPKHVIEYINENAEYDESIKIDPSIPLEKQEIFETSYKMLDTIIKEVEAKPKKDNNKIKVEESKNMQNENLIQDYVRKLKEKDSEIEELKKKNQQLYDYLKKIPKTIRFIFIKDENKKLLNDK